MQPVQRDSLVVLVKPTPWRELKNRLSIKTAESQFSRQSTKMWGGMMILSIHSQATLRGRTILHMRSAASHQPATPSWLPGRRPKHQCDALTWARNPKHKPPPAFTVLSARAPYPAFLACTPLSLVLTPPFLPAAQPAHRSRISPRSNTQQGLRRQSNASLC